LELLAVCEAVDVSEELALWLELPVCELEGVCVELEEAVCELEAVPVSEEEPVWEEVDVSDELGVCGGKERGEAEGQEAGEA
jgi:hypothetical protein